MARPDLATQSSGLCSIRASSITRAVSWLYFDSTMRVT